MKRKFNKKGFTLLEIMIVVAIVGVMVTFGAASLRGRAKKNAVISMTTKIPTFLKTYRDRSENEGKKYWFKFKLDENKIYVLENENDEIKDSIDVLKLSNKLLYESTTSGNQVFDRYTTTTGNFNIGFSIFILSKDKKEFFKKIVIRNNITGLQYAIISERDPKSSINSTNYDNGNDHWIK
ncbi:MAG: type II secretion system protein [Fusobacteriota bacterium]